MSSVSSGSVLYWVVWWRHEPRTDHPAHSDQAKVEAVMSFLAGTSVRDLTGCVTGGPHSERIGGCSDILKGELKERPTRRIWDILQWISPRTDRVEVAIKVIRVDPQMEPDDEERVRGRMMNEVTIWHRLDHFNVLPLLGIVQGVNRARLPALVSPWCERGTVSEYIRKNPPVADRISLMLQVVSAVSYLHSCDPPIVHGDLKSENCFLRFNYRVQLSDFGLAKIPQDGFGSRFSSNGVTGTIRWMGPELFPDIRSTDSIIPTRTLSSDIWALGCTLYEISTSLIPYQECSNHLRVINLVCGRSTPRRPANISSLDLKQLHATMWPVLEECWRYDPFLRLKAGEVARSVREAILLNHADCFYGPMFGGSVDMPRPSVIGEADPYALEYLANSETDKNQARALLAAAAIGYHSQHSEKDRLDAFAVQVNIGWNLFSQNLYTDARSHFELARPAFEALSNYRSLASCLRGLGEVAHGLGDLAGAVAQYTSALLEAKTGEWIDEEALITRALGYAILEQAEAAILEEKPALILRARQRLTEALSLSMSRGDPKLQAQVHCDLVRLEQDAGEEVSAQAHAEDAFYCAHGTGDLDLIESVYAYLEGANVLSDSQRRALSLALEALPLRNHQNV